MGPEWMLSLDGETTVSRVDSDNGSHIDDLQLFPDLQDLNKNTYTRSVSKKSFSVSSDGCDDDDELIGYFTRNDSTVQQGKASPPAQVQQQNVGKTTVAAGSRLNPKLKVVTVRQSVTHGGKVLVVQEANRPEAIGNNCTPNPIVVNCRAGPSSPGSSVEFDDNDSISQGLCMSKNAIAARENRLRKKNHIQILEKSVEELETENTSLKTDLTDMKGTIESLHTEVKYLRSVLANQSTLARLLENIPMVSDVSLTKSNDIGRASNSYKQSRKRPASVDEADILASDDECDCHPQKNVCMCSKENQGHSKTTAKFAKRPHIHTSEAKVLQPDHSYATDDATSNNSAEQPTHKMGTRGRLPADDETTGGVCLHVSGSSVSLEFCSSCSHKAAGSRRKVKN